MANPPPGTIEYAYNRMYVVVDPTHPSGPPTYRISIPDEIPGADGGGGGSNIVDYDGIPPIVVDTVPQGTGYRVDTSMDITLLNSRKA